MKSEIRNPKPETTRARCGFHWALRLKISFGLLISGFGFLFTFLIRHSSFLLLAGLAVLQTGQAQVTPIFTNSHPQSTLPELQGTYFNDTTLTTAVFTRSDATINFDWGFGAPDPRINPDNFSVRWIGKVVPLFSGNYTFYAVTDDGFRLWIDNQLIIDSWIDQGPTEHASTQIFLAGCLRHDLKAEFYEHSGGGVAQLSWSGPNAAKEIVGSPPSPDGTGDGFGTTLASIGGGQFAVGTPFFDVYTVGRSEEHTSELQSRLHLVCRLLLEKKKTRYTYRIASSTTRATAV